MYFCNSIYFEERQYYLSTARSICSVGTEVCTHCSVVRSKDSEEGWEGCGGDGDVFIRIGLDNRGSLSGNGLGAVLG